MLNHWTQLQIYSLLLLAVWALLIVAWDKVEITVCFPPLSKQPGDLQARPYFHRLCCDYRRGLLEFWEQMEDRFLCLSTLAVIVPVVLRHLHCMLYCYCDEPAHLFIIFFFNIVFVSFWLHFPLLQSLTQSQTFSCFTLGKGVYRVWLPSTVES